MQEHGGPNSIPPKVQWQKRKQDIPSILWRREMEQNVVQALLRDDLSNTRE
jgi:hypothetical protein